MHLLYILQIAESDVPRDDQGNDIVFSPLDILTVTEVLLNIFNFNASSVITLVPYTLGRISISWRVGLFLGECGT